MNKKTCKKIRSIAANLPNFQVKDSTGKLVKVNVYRRIKRAYKREGVSGILNFTNKLATEYAVSIDKKELDSVVANFMSNKN